MIETFYLSLYSNILAASKYTHKHIISINKYTVHVQRSIGILERAGSGHVAVKKQTLNKLWTNKTLHFHFNFEHMYTEVCEGAGIVGICSFVKNMGSS